jgi:acetyl esterase/lipase
MTLRHARVLASRDYLRAVHHPRRIIVGGDSARPELLAAAAVDARLSTGQAPTAAGCSSPRISRVTGSTAPARSCTSATARPAEPNPHGARGGRASLHWFEALSP